ncbi:MAG: GatB/YqeY domain-containing protein [Pseudomonadota bacterium]
MPALLDTLLTDIKTAMKAQDKVRLLALRTLHSEIKNIGINAGRELTDDDVIAAVGRAIKQRQDAIEQFKAGGRQDLVLKESAEIALYRAYQPAQLDRDAILELTRACIAESGASGKQDLGRVMKLLMPQVKGRADGKLVNQIVMELLG